MIRLAALGVALLLAGVAHGGNCGTFFVARRVYHAPIYYPPAILYQSGRDIEADALAEKIAARVEARLTARAQQTQERARPTLLTQKCVRCHNPTKASGDLVLDGSQAVPDSSYRRFHKMAGLGEDVPPEMEKVIAALTPEEKGVLTEELLRLEPQPLAKE